MGVTLLSIAWSVAACRIELDRASYNPLPPWVYRILKIFTAPRPSHDPTAAAYTDNIEEKKSQDDVNVFLAYNTKSLPDSPQEAFKDTRRFCQNRSVDLKVHSIDDWCLVTKAVDKLFFGLFLLHFIISFVYFMVQRSLI